MTRRLVVSFAVLAFLGAMAFCGPPSRAESHQTAGAQKNAPIPKKDGKQGWFGAELADLSAEEAAKLRLPGPGGVRVVGPVPGGPAARAHIKPGDIIFAIDGKPVANSEQFINAVRARKPGTRLRLRLVRDGRRRTIFVWLGVRREPGEFERAYGAALHGYSPDERVEAAEKALALEPSLKKWPPGNPRNLVRSALYEALADALMDKGADKDGAVRADNMERAIAAYEKALAEITPGALPTNWGRLKNSLGLAYWRRLRGEKADNIERAISHFEAALTVRTPQSSPQDWAGTQNNLGIVYKERIRGSKAENIEKAISFFTAALSVFSREKFPREWATAQSNLGNAYLERVAGERADNIERAILAFEAALTVHTREAMPRDWADSQNNLAGAYGVRIRGDHAENVEKSIAALEAALTVYTRENSPRLWAMAQSNLGSSYFLRQRGTRAENIEKAIAALESSLAIRTREAFPEAWANTQNTLASVYAARIHGSKADNLEKAIARLEAALTVYTRAAFPQDWARTKNNLGIAYTNRIRGERAENIEKAIAAFEAALTVHTRDAFPREWAETQINLGAAYQHRPHGEHSGNIERAIAAFEAALTVLNRDGFPRLWAMAHNNLGIAYGDRLQGERAENIEQAIGHFEAALTVFTPGSFPWYWATAQNNLGTAYFNHSKGGRTENIERAIAAHEAALTVFTREAFPEEWAETQSNLGNAYRFNPSGDRAENIEKAIAAFEAALTVLTRDAFPENWAKVQDNLGQAYQQRLNGSQAENAERSIAAWEAELRVFTQEGFPRDHLRAAKWLGHMYLLKGDWASAARVFAGARRAFLTLFGQGGDEMETRDLITLAGPLFSEASYAAARMGNVEDALALAMEGKARLLSVVLRLNTLGLPPQKQARLQALRAEIREQEQVARVVSGSWRQEALDRLAVLRRELQGLVQQGTAGAAAGSLQEQIQALLPQGGALTTPLITEVGGAILIAARKDAAAPLTLTVTDLPDLTAGRLAGIVLGPARDGREGWAHAYKNQLVSQEQQSANWDEWLTAVNRLGTDLWTLVAGPLDAALKAQGLETGARLIWVPSGALSILPLSIATNPANGRAFLESYEVVIAPGVEALVKAQAQIAKPAPPSLAAVVNPTNDLPSAEYEGAAVASYFPAERRTVLGPGQAYPAAVFNALKGKNYWHFASHGLFCWADARQSALFVTGTGGTHCGFRVSGAPLTIGQLLDEHGLGRPRLAVLSACESGISDVSRNPDEFQGLPAALLGLGAAGVVGTVWPVQDVAAALLAAKFYDLHLDGGLPPPAALRGAQLWLREATNEDVAAYALAAARRGRLPEAGAAGIQETMKPENLARGRYRAVIHWVDAPSPPPGTSATGGEASSPSPAEGSGAPPPAGNDSGVQPAAAAEKGEGSRALSAVEGEKDDQGVEDQHRATARKRTLARPYAHPYFWGAFTYTGL